MTSQSVIATLYSLNRNIHCHLHYNITTEMEISLTNKSVLIIGATGFCGQGTLHTLCRESDYSIIAHVRPESSNLKSLEQTCTTLGATLLTCAFEDITKHIEEIQPTVICSFIGTTKKKMKQVNKSYDDIDYQLNARLISAAQKLATPPLFVYVSSMGVEWAKWSAYLMARQKVEQDLGTSNLPHVILRPGILSGPTRTEPRPLEHIGAIVSQNMGQMARKLGWHQKADEWMPLEAEEIGTIVYATIDDWVEKQQPMITRTMLVHEIHAELRRLGLEY